MFHLGWSELLIVACLALVIVGPKDLPNLLRSIARGVGQARRLFRDMRASVEDVLSADDMKLLKGDVSDGFFGTDSEGRSRTFREYMDATPTKEVKQSDTPPLQDDITPEMIDEKLSHASGVGFVTGQTLSRSVPEVDGGEDVVSDAQHRDGDSGGADHSDTDLDGDDTGGRT